MNYRLEMPTAANRRVKALTLIAQWSLYIPPGLKFNSSALCSHSVYDFCVDLRTNSDYFPIQH
jgi:hypothetical protein